MKKQQPKINGELVVKADKKVVSQDDQCIRIIEISITPPGEKTRKVRTPLNLSLVLDRSGSMSGEKLHFVKLAAAHVIDLLDEKDIASVVTYDDQVETIIPPGNVTPEYKQQARARIQGIELGRYTFLSGGWLRGCALVAEGANAGTMNRTLLLTDGLANSGVTDINELSTHSQEIYRRGVSTSSFGVGLGYDEHLLEAMANSGGGNFHFLETINTIPLEFEREFKELVEISLREVEVSIPLPEGVKVAVLAGWPNDTDKRTVKISIGSLYSGREQRIYLKLEFKKGIEGSKISIPVTVRGKDGSDYVNESVETIAFKAVSAIEEKSAEIDRPLMERFAEVELADQATEALKIERAGDRVGASRVMRTSISENRVYMRASMLSKFSHLDKEISMGMTEESRKRHHREEYENKRGRAAERDYHLQRVNGHLIARIAGHSVLIDTGVPISIGNLTEFYFLNEVHPLSMEYLGVTLEYLGSMVGSPIDILMGMDILKKFCLTIDLPGNRVTFDLKPTIQSVNRVPMTNFMGVPITGVTLEGKERQMFVDTGARLSYVDKRIAANYSSVGNEKDFYPGMGEFETAVYDIPFQIGGQSFQLRCGVLPDLLASAVLVTGKSGLMGSELYQKFLVCLAFPQDSLCLEPIR